MHCLSSSHVQRTDDACWFPRPILARRLPPNSAAAGDGGELASVKRYASDSDWCEFAAAPEPQRSAVYLGAYR